MERFTKAVLIVLCSVFLGLAAAPSAGAYDLPSLNLGFTSFLDGAPPAGPGYYFSQYAQYWRSDEFKNHTGEAALPPAANEDFKASISLSQLIYQSDREVLPGAKWGVDVILPIVSLETGYGVTNYDFPTDSGRGIGDILVGPFLQWDPVLLKKGIVFMHRVELQLLLPTGRYEAEDAINPGSNVFSINPYWAGTAFLTPRVSASARLHYLWNGENDGTLSGAALRPGQAFHANFAVAYEVRPDKLRVGLNGYYLRQITDSELDDRDIETSPEEVLGLGPGLVWHISGDSHLFLNLYLESQVENRPEGTRLNLRYVHHF